MILHVGSMFMAFGQFVGAVATLTDHDRAHAQIMRNNQIAGIVLEKGGSGWVDLLGLDDLVIGTGVGLGMKIHLFHAPNRIEQVQPAPIQHMASIGAVGVGMDDLAAGQAANRLRQRWVRLQYGKVDIMHFGQIGAGFDPMFGHQPGQCGAVSAPIFVAQLPRDVFGYAKLAHDIGGHALFNLVKQRRRRVVKRVVQIKYPDRNIGKFHDLGHSLRDGRLQSSVARSNVSPMKDAYSMILSAIDAGVYQPGDRLVESELAERFGVSRTPIREALQRLETQAMLTRDGRSLIVATLDHNQLAELYTVRAELEALAARLAARHATPEEVRVLAQMIDEDRRHLDDPRLLARTNRRFHHQIHLASHNRYLVQQLDLVHRSMALMARTSLAAQGRGVGALDEHQAIVDAIGAGDAAGADKALRNHISMAWETRLKLGASVDD